MVGGYLPLLLNILKKYGSYSGYILNIHKTQVLTFNYTPNKELADKYKLNWHLPYIQYLGVYLPKDTSSLYAINYNRINKKIYTDLDRWAMLPLDLGSRVRSIKMNILP